MRSGGLGGCAALLLALFGDFGCTGGQTGQPRGDEGTDCPLDIHETVSDDQVPTLLDFSANDVLAWARGERAASARWGEGPDGITLGVPPGVTDISLTLARGEGPAFDAACGARYLEIPVEVEAKTKDGALSFTGPGALRATRADFAELYVDFGFDDLDGTFTWQSSRSGLSLVQPFLRATLSPDGWSGHFDAVRQLETSDAVSDLARHEPLLRWPADDVCAPGQVGTTLAEAEPFWRDLLGAANGAMWQARDDNGAEPVQLQIEAAGGLCASANMPRVLPVRVDLQTQDGAFDLVLEGELSEVSGGLQFDFGQRAPVSDPQGFVERFGDFGMDLSGYEAVQIQLTLRLSTAGGEGHVALVGMVDPCASQPSDQGCGPLEDHVLLERRFATASR